MSISQTHSGRDSLRQISTEQMAAAARVMQHWYARVLPAAHAPPASMDHLQRRPQPPHDSPLGM